MDKCCRKKRRFYFSANHRAPLCWPVWACVTECTSFWPEMNEVYLFFLTVSVFLLSDALPGMYGVRTRKCFSTTTLLRYFCTFVPFVSFLPSFLPFVPFNFVFQGRWEDALAILRAMVSGGVRPNVYTVCSALRACCLGQSPERLVSIYSVFQLFRPGRLVFLVILVSN